MAQHDTQETIENEVLAVDTETAARMLGIAVGTLENWRYERTGVRGPRFARIGRKIVYPVDGLREYLDAHTVHNAGSRKGAGA